MTFRVRAQGAIDADVANCRCGTGWRRRRFYQSAEWRRHSICSAECALVLGDAIGRALPRYSVRSRITPVWQAGTS